jgi:putative proteasome-type protease
MTYCVGMLLDEGLVFMSDTRTNAGLDDIATAKKMTVWSKPGERVITLLTAGNLATTQAVVSLLDERTKVPAERKPSILEAPTMFQVARIIGDTLGEVVRAQGEASAGAQGEVDPRFNATLIVGGQIAGVGPRLFLVYPEGNFIEATPDTPYFQIGETKYGRPILVRVYNRAMSFEDAVKLLLVSFDSTIKANLSVGLPLDLHAYQRDSLEVGSQLRVEPDDAYYQHISSGWGEALRAAFDSLPDFKF